jgi:ABC-type dipeptide/oligopeptide/nickel transport system permease component
LTKYIIRRVFWAIPVLLLVALAVFVLIRAMPGGPFDFMGDKALPPSVVKNLEAKYHLDWPVWQQFCAYVLGDKVCTLGQEGASPGLLQGDMGPSYRYRGRTVNDIIASGLPVSAQLGLLSMVIAVIPGILLGVIAALRQNTSVDYLATFGAILGASISPVVLGPALIFIFALELNWFPVARWGGTAPYFLGILPKPDLTFWQHAVLPCVALGSGLAARITRLTRASLLQVVREDYIRTARAKGLHERVVILRHALKNSLIPVVTVLGPMFAAVLTGTFVVEQLFAIPGLGKHFITSVGNRDYPVVLGTTLLYGVAIVAANLFVDIAYAWLDPRIRYD